MSNPMMQCGHVANSLHNGQPACVICAPDPKAHTVATEKPDLAGRMALCETCGKQIASSLDLAFFEYRGSGSERANTQCKKCNYHLKAHLPEVMAKNNRLKCTEFEPRGAFDTDLYYCGCRGWD